MITYIDWYYYPFYGAILASFLVYGKMRKKKLLVIGPKGEGGILNIKNRIFISFIFAFFLSVIFHGVFPATSMGVPSGPHKVGTRIYEWEDHDRIEVYGENVGNNYRKIKVQAWYPAKKVQGYQRVPWIPEGRVVSRQLARIFYFPPFMLDQSEEVLSNSYLDAPIFPRDKGYPVVVLSHGWSGFRTLHSDLGELLASHGFIVFGIDHTYGAPVVVFDNGEELTIDGKALPSREDSDFLGAAEKLIATYAQDIIFVLDILSGSEPGLIDKSLVNALDEDNIGLLGHSTGGGAGVQVAVKDFRIRGIIGLDPWVEPLSPSIIKKPIPASYLFLRSEEWKDQNNNKNLYEILKRNNQGELFQILGTTHVDFTMVHMYSPITSAVGLTGSLERSRFEDIQEGFILSFFENTLKKGTIEEWSYPEEEYPEVYRVPMDSNK